MSTKAPSLYDLLKYCERAIKDHRGSVQDALLTIARLKGQGSHCETLAILATFKPTEIEEMLRLVAEHPAPLWRPRQRRKAVLKKRS